MSTVADRLTAARARLEAAGIPSSDAAIDADVLARHLLGWDRARLIVRLHEAAPDALGAPFDALVARRAAREPVAQIVGHREFWGLDFEVTPDVLIPRPETEIIVEAIAALSRERRIRRVADVGTGSGCLAVSIAHELPEAEVVAIDTSEPALAVARRNADRHGVASRMTFLRADVLDGVDGPFDVIVSNPPYVPDAERAGMQPEVLRYEPHLALFGGPTGLEIVRRLFEQGGSCLAAAGHLVVEFGFGQAGAVRALATSTGWHVDAIRDDLQGIPRTIILSRAHDG